MERTSSFQNGGRDNKNNADNPSSSMVVTKLKIPWVLARCAPVAPPPRLFGDSVILGVAEMTPPSSLIIYAATRPGKVCGFFVPIQAEGIVPDGCCLCFCFLIPMWLISKASLSTCGRQHHQAYAMRDDFPHFPEPSTNLGIQFNI